MWTELNERKPKAIDLYRRNLQRSYIEQLISLSDKTGKDYRDVGPIVKNKLLEIQTMVKKAARKSNDPMTTYHLKFIDTRLTEVLGE
jgi:hypothetical protein